MKTQFQDLYKTARDTHMAVYDTVKRDIEPAIKRERSTQEVADMVYALRETLKHLEDMTKEVRRLEETAVKVVCAMWMRDAGLDEDAPENVKTPYCTLTPELKTHAKVPSRKTDPDAHTALMEHLGVPRAMYENDAMRIHWPGFVEYITQLNRDGLPLPPGIDPATQVTIYSARVHKRKAVTE